MTKYITTDSLVNIWILAATSNESIELQSLNSEVWVKTSPTEPIDGDDRMVLKELEARSFPANGVDNIYVYIDKDSRVSKRDLSVMNNVSSSQTYSQDAWGRNKVINDISILHGMFTYSVPASIWKEEINNVEQSSFVNATSINGMLNLTSSLVADEKILLRTFRNPRYQPNRGHLYSSSIILPNRNSLGIRRFGDFTSESGEFFELDNGILYGVVRTTIDGITSDDRRIIDTTGIDLESGNVFDIQKQWRGVGNYYFYINLKLVLSFGYLGTLDRLSSFDPALPISFECINKGNQVTINCGCVDVSSEGGQVGSTTYGSIGMTNVDGQVAIDGYNVPILVIRNKELFNGKINTRDVLSLLLTAYGDQRSFIRVWATRDISSITLNDQSWQDFADGHLEYLTYDQPDVITPMTFDTTKASNIFGSRVDQDTSYSTSALFEGRTEIYQTPGDIFIFTMHRETGATMNCGVTFEFGELI